MQTGTKTRKLDRDKVARLRERVMALRPMSIGWRKTFVETFPEYDDVTGFNLLGNVASCKVLHEPTIEKMESLFKRQ